MRQHASHMYRRPRLAGLAAALFIGLMGVVITKPAMAFSNTLTLFSEVEGTVLQNGQALEGVEIEQAYHWHWKDEQRTHRTRSDAQGRFSFAAVTARSLGASLLPHEPVIGQRLTLHHQGKQYKGWVFTKHNYDDRGEVPGRPLRLTCHLEALAVAHPETETFGMCVLAP